MAYLLLAASAEVSLQPSRRPLRNTMEQLGPLGAHATPRAKLGVPQGQLTFGNLLSKLMQWP